MPPSPPTALLFYRWMPLVAVLIAVAGGWLGDWTRHELIEPVARAAACVETPAPWWCLLRDGLRVAAQNYVIAGTAVVAALASLLYRGRGAVTALAVAMFLGGMGIYLYSTSIAAIAVTLALLRAASLDRT